MAPLEVKRSLALIREMEERREKLELKNQRLKENLLE
jgi:hypothetical protein